MNTLQMMLTIFGSNVIDLIQIAISDRFDGEASIAVKAIEDSFIQRNLLP